MKTLLEILTEICGTVECKGKEYFEIDDESLKATFDDYCKQFEPNYQVYDEVEGWNHVDEYVYNLMLIPHSKYQVRLKRISNGLSML